MTVTSAVMSWVPGSTGVESDFAAAPIAWNTGVGALPLLGDRGDRADAEAAGLGQRLRLQAGVVDGLAERVAVERVAVRHVEASAR